MAAARRDDGIVRLRLRFIVVAAAEAALRACIYIAVCGGGRCAVRRRGFSAGAVFPFAGGGIIITLGFGLLMVNFVNLIVVKNLCTKTVKFLKNYIH